MLISSLIHDLKFPLTRRIYLGAVGSVEKK